MNLTVTKKFTKDVEKIKDPKIREKIKEFKKLLESCLEFESFINSKIKHVGSEENIAFYRYRINNYRLGFAVENNEIVFIRFLHRKDIYKYFPPSNRKRKK